MVGKMSIYRDPYQKQREDQAWRAKEKADTDFIHGIVWAIIPLLSLAVGRILAVPFRYGYGKHFLFLIFVAPLLLIFGWVAVELAMKIHAEPQVFLAHWQAHVIRHPAAVHWTWLVRDFVDLCRW
jgi:hypothetical protein